MVTGATGLVDRSQGNGIPEGIPAAPAIRVERVKKTPLESGHFFDLVIQATKPVRQIWLAQVKSRPVLAGCQFGSFFTLNSIQGLIGFVPKYYLG